MILDLTFRSFPGHNTVGLMCFAFGDSHLPSHLSHRTKVERCTMNLESPETNASMAQ
jgi:hypothetical protein